MIYNNKIYSIEDIAKRLKIKESDINILINLRIIPTVDFFETKFLEGKIVLSLKAEIKKFNEELKKGKLPKGKFKKDREKGTIEVPEEGLINE